MTLVSPAAHKKPPAPMNTRGPKDVRLMYPGTATWDYMTNVEFKRFRWAEYPAGTRMERYFRGKQKGWR